MAASTAAAVSRSSRTSRPTDSARRCASSCEDWIVWGRVDGPRGSSTLILLGAAEAAEELRYRAAWMVDEGRRAADSAAGVLDAWVRENGEWIGRVRDVDGRYLWLSTPRLLLSWCSGCR
ncbi:hypothetical protein ACQPYH_06400 [Kribbella sp. CA-245084]|uniref:hypothetical protein n=1 Tax=Kribbella sp. CA-245084 TaxID=3239940 RepID=UPI003D8FDDCF